MVLVRLCRATIHIGGSGLYIPVRSTLSQIFVDFFRIVWLISTNPKKEGKHMLTNEQKATILSMREQSISYADIAELTGVSVNRAKQSVFRQRHKGQIRRCAQCNKVMTNSNNRPSKRFCSNGCRFKWWYVHRDQLSTLQAHTHNCVVCGKEFFSFKEASFCSRSCYSESMRGTKVTHA